MSDTKKKFPIYEMQGYDYIRSQLIDSESIALYESGNGSYKIGEIMFIRGHRQPTFWIATGLGIMIQLPLDVIQEITRYMEFIQKFGISVEFEGGKDDNQA